MLAILVNAATFCSFTYLAVIASGPAGITDTQIPLLLAVFGLGAFGGVMFAGRYADAHWSRVIGIGGPALVAGWGVFAVLVGYPVGVWVLALALGAVSFALGSTVIARIVAEAREAPTMGGSFATAALNVGAMIGPIAGGIAIESIGVCGPLLASAIFALFSVVLWTVTRAAARAKPTMKDS